jgi:hypothetical protein
MAEQGAARKNAQWMVVFKAPDVCKTPMGAATPPIPYPVTAMIAQSDKTVSHVHAAGDPLVVYDASFIPTTLGDQAGVALGTKSSTVGNKCWPKAHSPSVMAGNKFLIRNDEEYWMNGNYTGDEAAKKAARYECRKEQIAAGKKSDDPNAKAAAERFERNNTAIEKAKLAQDVYDPSKGPPTGWKNISNDPEALAKHGLEPEDLKIKGSEFRSQVYEPDPAVFGNDMKPSVAFKGTTPSSMEDWKNNGAQGINMNSPYYRRSTEIGTKISTGGSPSEIDVVGHSLGGGMASSASTASGSTAWTFNSAGLNTGTVTKYGGTSQATDITAYRVKGEILTAVQEQGIGSTLVPAAIGLLFGGPVGAAIGGLGKMLLSSLISNAKGATFDVNGSGVNPVARHGMDQVIEGIEEQKKEDEATLSKAIGKSCS